MRHYHHVNDQLRLLSDTMPLVGYVPADGLSCKPDRLHFNTPSLEAFGLRYYRLYKSMARPDKLFPEKPGEDAAVRRAMELL